MTVEKKRKMIEGYCHRVECDNCPLSGVESFVNGCFTNIDDTTIEKNFRIIFGEDKEPTPEEIVEPYIDPVNRPAHYTDGNIEVIDYIEDKKLGFCLGNAIKYISRAGKKDPSKEVEDLNKAIWYIKRRIKEIEEARE